MAQEADNSRYTQHVNLKQYKNDDVVQQTYNKETQDANIKQVYKVSVTELSAQLYIGTQWQAHDTKSMNEVGITHLISCMNDDWGFVNNLKPLEDNRCEIKEMQTDENKYDKDTLPLNDMLNNYVIPFVDVVLKDEKNKILFYCKSATNNSPTIAIITVMYSQKKNLKEAYDFVKGKHGKLLCVSDAWMKQLRELDNKLYGKYSTKSDDVQTKEAKMAAILAKMQKAKAQLAQEQQAK
eukprot:312438_1